VASLKELLSTRGLLTLRMKDELDESRAPAIEDSSDDENRECDYEE